MAFGIDDIILGSVIGGLFSSANQSQAISASDEQFDKAIDYNEKTRQENFSYLNEYNKTIWNREDTAMQRAVSDAVSAGFSPLAVTGGAGAGGTSSVPQLDNSNAGLIAEKGSKKADMMIQGFNSTVNNAIKVAELENLQAQNSLTLAQADKVKAESDLLEPKFSFEKSKESNLMERHRQSLSMQDKIALRVFFSSAQGRKLQRDLADAELQYRYSSLKQSKDFHSEELLDRKKARANAMTYQSFLAEQESKLRRSENAEAQEMANTLAKERYIFENNYISDKDKMEYLFRLIDDLNNLTQPWRSSFGNR